MKIDPRMIQRWAAGAVVTAVATAGLAAAADAGPPAASQSISQLQQEAARIESELETLGAQVEVLDEQYRQTEDRLAATKARLEATRRQVEGAQASLAQATGDASNRIVAMYEDQATAAAAGFLAAGDMESLVVGVHYTTVVDDEDRSVIGNLSALRNLLTREEQTLGSQQAQVKAQEADLSSQRSQVEAVVAARRRTLTQVKGRLAQLVEQERRRRAAAAARKAREAAARRAAAEARAKAPSPPAVDSRAAVAVRTAMNQIGKPYRWAGDGPASFDCSGLTRYAWAAAGVALPHSSAAQKAALSPVPTADLRPGDLVFFGNPVHHVGLFIGKGRMVDAPDTGETVRIDSIYRSDYAGAGRPR